LGPSQDLCNEAAIVWLVSAILHKQNDEWRAPLARYIILASVTGLRDITIVSLPLLAN
jgi:hypothetical protein